MEEIEQFPVVKRRIKPEEPPQLIFFDVDEDAEEADFIRVDDLFRDSEAYGTEKPSSYTFTLIPRRKNQIIDSRTSRLIHRTMVLCAFRLQHPIEKIRIRPRFVQWQLKLEQDDVPEILVREFRSDLEDQFCNLQNLKENDSYWADICFICPASVNMTDGWICEMAEAYQEDEKERCL